ncbi:hypothetical protein TcWFU_010153 [Taenia crassiceps]|uniref:Uncharacterized protein n=1 Tax=Taenia crassiceps TaxID=6207 RepID=A0ABR4Q0I6_9CEST
MASAHGNFTAYFTEKTRQIGRSPRFHHLKWTDEFVRQDCTVPELFYKVKIRSYFELLNQTHTHSSIHLSDRSSLDTLRPPLRFELLSAIKGNGVDRSPSCTAFATLTHVMHSYLDEMQTPEEADARRRGTTAVLLTPAQM